jgi:ubiquinone/menaquinone biosynthesis C-methylase UbiE
METTSTMASAAHPLTLRWPAEKLCLAVSRLFIDTPLRRLNLRENTHNNRYDSMENYVEERVGHVVRYHELFSPHVSLRNKTVLDLGCSSGYILNSFLEREPFTAIGADISADLLAQGRAQYGDRIRFVQTTRSSIPIDDDSVDVIYAVDTLEHLSEPEAILRDAYRILKPGGLCLVHFGPWYGVCGAHLEDIIPFPWPQVFFSMDTLLKVAAHIYDSPDHTPACYWIDASTGQRRANPYLDRERWRTYLNHVTVGKFKRIVRALPFETVSLQCNGFSGRTFKAARALSWLARVPILTEVFTSYVFCVLRKRAAR